MRSPSPSQLAFAQQVADSAARAAGDFLLDRKVNRTGLDIDRKRGLDIVTDADRSAEQLITRRISAAFPEHRMLSEESGAAGPDSSGHVWVIDPLDGTINYAAGLPYYSVSVALTFNGETVVGAVCVPETAQLYSVRLGGGATCNDEPIAVCGETCLRQSVLSFMLTSHYSASLRDRTLSVLAALAPETRGLRLLVSQAYELALVASGRLQGTVCNRVEGFSSAAGALLVTEAGGVALDLAGHVYAPTRSSSLISAASENLSRELLARLDLVPSVDQLE